MIYGASVTLLPDFVYEQLGLGELKPTKVVLLLADRFICIPRWVVEDVLVQVDKFYFPVDFIILDTKPISQASTLIPIILGRPFLATSNALINCRNGVMKLTIGNMTIKLNIFNTCKQPADDDGEINEVNMIQTLAEGKSAHSMFSNPIEACLLNSNNDDIELDMINALLDATPAMDNNKWKSCFEELPTLDKIYPYSVQAPKLDLKPFSSELKYAYLGQDEIFPVAISVYFNENLEKDVLNVLREHKAVPYHPQISGQVEVSNW